MTTWALIAVLGGVTYALKAAGPVAAGRMQLPRRLAAPLPFVAPAVLAGLVVTATFATGDELVVDERAAGLGAAAVAIALRAPPLAAVVVAAAVTALARAAG